VLSSVHRGGQALSSQRKVLRMGREHGGVSRACEGPSVAGGAARARGCKDWWSLLLPRAFTSTCESVAVYRNSSTQ
jgi:hypothetical protein